MTRVGQYEIDIYRDDTFNPRSVDNSHHYDFIYFNADDYIMPTMLGIKVFEQGTQLASAIIGSIGGGTGVHENSVIFEDSRMVICCSDSVFCLSIPHLTLNWQTKADSATCFEIFKYEDSYIIHGEMEISRLGKDGKILWQQSGADIFTTLDGEQDFILTDDLILAKDFEGQTYKFDYEGNSLK